MPGAKLGDKLGSLKLTCPAGGNACAPAAAPNSPAIVSAIVATMARRRLRPSSTEWEPIRPDGLSPPADTWNHARAWAVATRIELAHVAEDVADLSSRTSKGQTSGLTPSPTAE